MRDNAKKAIASAADALDALGKFDLANELDAILG